MAAGESAARWLDGRLLAADEALLDLREPGVFTTLRCEDGAFGFLAAHEERLARDARVLELGWPPPWDARAALQVLADCLAAGAWAVRIAWSPPHLALSARPVPALPRHCVARIAAPGEAEPPRPHGVKTLARSAYDRLREEARAAGAFEALVLDGRGRLVEGTVSNVFVAGAGVLATPPLAAGALNGIVRAALLAELASAPFQDGDGRTWRVAERDLDLTQLLAASEVLVTNSVVGVVALTGLVAPDGSTRELPGEAGAVYRVLASRCAHLERASRRYPRPDRC